MFWLVVLLICTVIFIAHHYVTNRRRDYLISKIPGPKKLPIFHNALELLGASPVKIFKWLDEQAKIHGPVWQLTVSPFDSGLAAIGDVKAVEAILTSQQLDKTKAYDLIMPWIGTGLLTSTGQKWFQRRKLLTPGFHFQILERFVEIMDEQAKVFVQQFSQHVGQKVDIFPLVNLYALDTVCEAALGTNIHAQTTDSAYLRAVKDITTIAVIRTFDESKRNNFLFRFTKMYEEEQKSLKVLHDFTNGVIRKRRQDSMNNNVNNNNEDNQDIEFVKKKKKALLDILLCSTVNGQPLSDADIREEVDTFTFAGHDTTSSGISFTFYNIAKYPEIQQKVYEEIMEVCGSDDDVNMQKLNDLRFLDLVMKESLRMYPPVPYYGRKLNEEFSAAGYTFPKGMDVYVAPYLLGRNPDLYKNPEKFDPYRFDVETNYEKFNPFGFVPFSAGPRNCIGQKFAQYELKTLICNVIKNFKLTLCEGQDELELVSELILRPVNGVSVIGEKRK